MKEKKILLSCPVRDRSWILPKYLNCIHNLDYPKHLISILWVINNSSDNSEEILHEFKSKYEHEYHSIIIEHFNKNKNVPSYDRKVRNKVKIDSKGNKTIVPDDSITKIYTHLADLRNHMLSKIDDNDYLFSCDSDILVKSDILNKLLSHKKDIVSSLIYNGHLVNPSEPWRFPNILKQFPDGKIEHIANAHVKNAPYSSDGKLLKVDISGAVYLLSQKVCKSVKYSYHAQGEDVSFCLDAKNKGFEIWCDTGCFSQHVMNKEMLLDM